MEQAPSPQAVPQPLQSVEVMDQEAPHEAKPMAVQATAQDRLEYLASMPRQMPLELQREEASHKPA